MITWIHEHETVVGPGHLIGITLKPVWFLQAVPETLGKPPQISLKNLFLFIKVREDQVN